MKIITDVNDKILRGKAQPVEKLTAEIKDFINQMFELMIEEKGVGLSANQVGFPFQIIVFTDVDQIRRYALINPRIIKTSRKECEMEEACLSVKDTFGVVSRPEKIILEAKNIDGKKVRYKFNDILARIVQHELDHLNGVLFVDKAVNIYQKNKLNENEL